MSSEALTLVAALLGAIIGAAASTVGSIAMQSVSRTRGIRAGQLVGEVPQLRRAVDSAAAELRRGGGPISLAHFVNELENLERQALTAGWRDARRSARLVELAHETWRLERDVWHDSPLGREPCTAYEDAIEDQLRLVVRVGGALDNYELWLRRHLLKPWWRRTAPWVPWPERYE